MAWEDTMESGDAVGSLPVVVFVEEFRRFRLYFRLGNAT